MIEAAPEALAALQTFVQVMDELGIGGIIALILMGPVVMTVAIFALDFLRQRHVRQEDAQRRQEAAAADEERRQEAKADRDLIRQIMEDHRKQTAALLEVYRSETAEILRDLGAKHTEVSQYYKDNVDLLKTTQRLASDLRDIVVCNTRAVERLGNVIETNFYCPAAREAATGRK